jgi:uncharacterized membrane protein (UPF0127 family)
VSGPRRRRGAAALGILLLAGLTAGLVALARRGDDGAAVPATLPTAPAGTTGSGPPPDGAPALAEALAAAEPAAGRFEGWTEARVSLADRCLRVVVADEEAERGQGLRGVADPAPYDGMVFVYGDDVDSPYTMSGVPVDLDIAWFDASGRPVDRTTMAACPDGTDETCPLYRASRRFRLALETPAGGHGPGALGGCSA